ncbi:hypothetical protein CHISP_1549 [Chitinispirillum alkaliphilum]|nr:hypothetical protein CHISP_1549 [Chitinispirillum alkaliphilum]
MINRFPKLREKCTGCGACMSICGQKAIVLEIDDEGFYYPAISENKCVSCGLCAKVCPELKEKKESPASQEAYYGWHSDNSVRLKSSSGGVFSTFAESTIEEGGVVFGACFDDEYTRVSHCSSRDTDYEKFRKSKYVQSFTGDCFKKVLHELESDKKVLFSGTPCQVSGLVSYLKRPYSNLVTCDFVCHGVPPSKLLNDHLNYIQKRTGKKISSVDFRPKVLGWSNQTLKCTFAEGAEYVKIHTDDAYFTAFYENLSLRKCCYSCNYSENHHRSDITVADFWGYKSYDQSLNDEQGLSLVIANTSKGKEVIGAAKSISLFPLEWMYAEYVYKKRNKESYSIEKRTDFFRYYLQHGWEKTIRAFKLEMKMINRIKIRIKKKLFAQY